MIVNRIAGATHTLGKPRNWDDDEHGNCLSLPIRAEEINGLPCLTSSWQPTPEELAQLNAGAPIYLRIIATSHPPVMLEVGPAPRPIERQCFAETHADGSRLCRECELTWNDEDVFLCMRGVRE